MPTKIPNPKSSFSGAADMVIEVLNPNVHRLVYTIVFGEYNIEIALRFLLNFLYIFNF